MRRVIKKTIQDSEPAIIDHPRMGRNEIRSRPDDGNGGRHHIDLSGAVREEISRWKGNLAKELDSRQNDAANELERSFDDGYRKGLADGAQRERDERIKAIDNLLKDAKRKSERAIRGLELKVIELAAMIAEKIVRKNIETDPMSVLSIVEDAMSHLIGSEVVVLKVSQDDYIAINERYDRWLSMAGNAREFRIEVDKRLRRGDCMVETEGGIIDAVISERIDVIVEELLKVSG